MDLAHHQAAFGEAVDDGDRVARVDTDQFAEPLLTDGATLL
jgi:hypothetical protein